MSDVELRHADALDALRELPDSSVDAVVTDPPYGLTSVVQEPNAEEILRHWLAGDDYEHRGSGFLGKGWDSFVPGPAVWRECNRVLKPGGHLAAFASPRTADLLGMALRLGGLHRRDTILGGYPEAGWVYLTGAPKEGYVDKLVDSHLKVERPAARRTVEATLLEPEREEDVTRTSGMRAYTLAELDGEWAPRLLDTFTVTEPGSEEARQWAGFGPKLKPAYEPIVLARKKLQTWNLAPNLLRHGTGVLNIDGCMTNGRWPANITLVHDESCGPSGCADNCPVRDLDEQAIRAGWEPQAISAGFGTPREAVDRPSAIFFCPKASQAERHAGVTPRAAGDQRANFHLTVKPLRLMQWLVRLVTPPGGVVLDPFMGSGTTGCAAVLEGLRFLGIDNDAESVRIAGERIEHWRPTQLTLGS